MTDALTTTVVDEPMDFIVYANNPADMVGAQKSMILWCARKIMAERTDLTEAQTQLDAAVKHKWSPTAWRAQVKKIEDRLEFYKKVKMALEAGYYIVPPFPVEVFAIRTDAKTPRGKWKDSRWYEQAQSPRMLPAGEGRYVSPRPSLMAKEFPTKNHKGEMHPVAHYHPDKFLVPDFPFKLAKAEIMHATQAAMALKVFDQLGVLPVTRNPDPMVTGHILMPHRKGQSVTFFVSWWLDTKTL